MASFNKVILIGNLTRDPDLRYTASGSAIASFGLAINRKFKQGDEWKTEVCYVDVNVWGKQGENCAEYLKKGRPAMVEGYLRLETWESNGQKRNKLSVTADNVQFLGQGNGKEKAETPGDYDRPEEGDIPF
jgi:single-strand DNA-binding protein